MNVRGSKPRHGDAPWLPIYAVLVFAFLYLPIVVLIVYSFNGHRRTVVAEEIV